MSNEERNHVDTQEMLALRQKNELSYGRAMLQWLEITEWLKSSVCMLQQMNRTPKGLRVSSWKNRTEQCIVDKFVECCLEWYGEAGFYNHQTICRDLHAARQARRDLVHNVGDAVRRSFIEKIDAPSSSPEEFFLAHVQDFMKHNPKYASISSEFQYELRLMGLIGLHGSTIRITHTYLHPLVAKIKEDFKKDENQSSALDKK